MKQLFHSRLLDMRLVIANSYPTRAHGIIVNYSSSCNISKTSASVSSGVPNTEKVMKARGRRPSAFIVSRCLEPLMKHEA